VFKVGTSRNYQTQGIILKQTKLGEFDKIVTIYTPEFGKLRAVAKGACRTKSKLGGNVEPLTHSSMLLAKGRNLDIVTQSQTINGFLTLKSDLWRMACGLYILELIDSFTVEGGENRPLFDLLLDILNQLSESDSNEAILRYFELHLLHHFAAPVDLRPHFAEGLDREMRLQRIHLLFHELLDHFENDLHFFGYGKIHAPLLSPERFSFDKNISIRPSKADADQVSTGTPPVGFPCLAASRQR